MENLVSSSMEIPVTWEGPVGKVSETGMVTAQT